MINKCKRCGKENPADIHTCTPKYPCDYCCGGHYVGVDGICEHCNGNGYFEVKYE